MASAAALPQFGISGRTLGLIAIFAIEMALLGIFVPAISTFTGSSMRPGSLPRPGSSPSA